jgi:hypothetical protein
MKAAYDDKDVINNIEEYKCNTISHRIDNDADSDDEQIKTGIKKMHMFLVNIINENKIRDKENVKDFNPVKIHYGRIY